MSQEFKIGSITSSYRPIRSGKEYNRLFPKPDKQDNIIIEDGDVYETVNLMQEVVWKYLDDTKQIAMVLKANTIHQTAQNIWDFLYHHIQYKLDKKGTEELRRPARSWYERQIGIDCDCFSIFASSILTNLKIQHKFRITKYEEDVFQHVYVIISHKGSSIIIDPVLHEFNYEKPFTEKLDIAMNLDGINIAVLSGPTGNDLYDTIMSTELDGTGLGDPNKESEALFRYLVKTRNAIAENPELFSHFEDTEGFIHYLEYAIQHWHTPNREQALAILAQKEDEFNQLHGFHDYDDMDEELLGRVVRRKKATKVPKKKFFRNLHQASKKIKQGAKKVGKGIIRYNPATVAARNGYLLAMKLDVRKMASRLIWAYLPYPDAIAKGVNKEQLNNARRALPRVEKLFVDKLQGKREALKNAIMKGKAGKKANIGELNGLGEAATAATAAALITAATPIIVATIKILNDTGLLEKKDNEQVEITEEDVKRLMEQEANEDHSQSSIPDDVQPPKKATVPNPNPTITFIKKNPMVVVGGIAALGGIGYLLLSNDNNKKEKKQLSGTQKDKNKTNKDKYPDKMDTIELD